MEVDRKIIKFWGSISSVQKAAFFSTIIWGLITHLAVFSAGLMYHDAVAYSGLCATYTSGRWMLGLLEDIGNRCLGVYQVPYINGMITILLMAVVSMMAVKMLKVRSLTVSVLIGAIPVSFPSVASLFAFTFTAAAYSLSLLLSVLSAYILNDKRTPGRVAAAVVLMCMSLGIYQAYITFAVSLALLTVFCDVLREKDGEIAPLIKKGVCYIAVFIASLLMYLLVNKLFISVKNLTLTAYQGINTMGKLNLRDIKSAVMMAYSDQIRVVWSGIISSKFMTDATRCCEILTVLLFVIVLYSNRENPGRCLLAAVLFLLFPLAFNSIYLLCSGNRAGIHALTRLSLSFTYILPLMLFELLPNKLAEKKGGKLLSAVTLALILVVPLSYTYRNNTAYLHSATSQKQAILYFNSLITRIRDTDGYEDGMPVAYLGWGIGDQDFGTLPTQENIYTYGLCYSGLDLVNSFQWRDFCALHLGWKPEEVANTNALRERADVKAMPCYPDSGSIKIIDDTIVVKLSETE